jgi:hypothetical protein
MCGTHAFPYLVRPGAEKQQLCTLRRLRLAQLRKSPVLGAFAQVGSIIGVACEPVSHRFWFPNESRVWQLEGCLSSASLRKEPLVFEPDRSGHCERRATLGRNYSLLERGVQQPWSP